MLSERSLYESVTAIHTATGRHFLVNAGAAAGRAGRLPRTADLRPAPGRLPDHTGGDAVSRRKPGGHDVAGHLAFGAPTRSIARLKPDVVVQFRRRVGHHITVQPEPESGYSRTGSAGGHQRRQQLLARRPADAAGLQQNQPRRRTYSDSGRQLEDAAFAQSRGSGGHPSGAKTVAIIRRGSGHYQRRPTTGGAHSGQSVGAGGLRLKPGRLAHGDSQCQRQSA